MIMICHQKFIKLKKHNGGDFKNLFKSVISDHLDADTPVDLFLSGGIDSSLLALTVKNELSKKFATFLYHSKIIHMTKVT